MGSFKYQAPVDKPFFYADGKTVSQDWRLFFQKVAQVTETNEQQSSNLTGDIILTSNPADRIGCFKVTIDGTIGNSASGASQYANDDCQALYIMWWDQYTQDQLPVDGGRGDSALDDFTAGKPIAMPAYATRQLAIAGENSLGTERLCTDIIGDLDNSGSSATGTTTLPYNETALNGQGNYMKSLRPCEALDYNGQLEQLNFSGFANQIPINSAAFIAAYGVSSFDEFTEFLYTNTTWDNSGSWIAPEWDLNKGPSEDSASISGKTPSNPALTRNPTLVTSVTGGSGAGSKYCPTNFCYAFIKL